jgi:CelD/BcsL family acetyltransferase involved in cellulose biosynthesis
VRIEQHDSPSAFETLAPEWDALISPDQSHLFFMRTDWQRTWWKHLHRGQLSIMTARDDSGTLRGVAPCFVEQSESGVRSLNVVGCADITDYVDWIYSPGYERPVMEAFWSTLCQTTDVRWDQLHICNVPEQSQTLRIMPELALQSGLRVDVTLEDVCPVVTLPDAYETYLESLDKKQRHELRRKRRKAETHPVEWYVVGSEHDLSEEIDAFLDLMASSTPEKAGFLKERGHRDFFREIGPLLFANGMLDLTFLVVDGQRAAAMWNFTFGKRMMLYNSGIRSQEFMALSPGIVLLTFNIEHSIQSGYTLYDFLQGNETYKYRMGAQSTRVFNLSITR